MLEIVFSDSEKLLLERSNLFNKEDILSLTFLLSMGKLDDFEYQTKRTIGDIEVNIPSEISKLKNKVKDYKNIRIWYASNVNEDYLSMMYVVYLCSDKNIQVVDGYQRYGISGYADDEIKDLVNKYSIFARVLPHQKSIIVKALQEKGHKVAMTGDGVNDVIALKEADCSITLPDATDSAKQVSQIVLLNSDFSILKDVLMEGRRVVNNITNVAKIFFIKTIYTVLLSIFCFLTNMEFPFIPIQITLIDLAIEAYTSFFITFEKNEKKIKGTFLKTALTNALPFALVIILNIVFLTVMGTRFGIEYSSLKTMMYLLIGFVSILAVQEVCTPFNKIHAFLFSTTAVGFYTAVLLFHNILKVDLIDNKALIITGILAIISYVLINIKRVIYKKIFN